jgi:exodeoxyribonuclease VII small subunit
MSKPESKNSTADPAEPSFESAFAKLEEIVRALEEGQLGLSDSLARYTEAVQCLKQCHGALEQAERKIMLLTGTDAEGNPVVEPLDDQALTLEQKQQRRGQRRSTKNSAGEDGSPAGREPDGAVDNQKGLF